jgi:hypothetical protein
MQLLNDQNSEVRLNVISNLEEGNNVRLLRFDKLAVEV